MLIDAEVTRYHDPEALAAGHSFTIAPVGEQVGSLEFQHFAEQVATALQASGLHAIPPDGGQADLVVHIRYGGSGVRTEVDTFGNPDVNPYTWYWGPDGQFVPNERVFIYPMYGHYLEVDLLDAAALHAGKTKMVFQGRSAEESDSHDINPVFPILVKVLFADFPGANGQTEHLRVPVS